MVSDRASHPLAALALVCFALLFMASTIALAGPAKVVFDTDISSDVDDCGALAVLNALADKGEAQLMACVVNGHDADKSAVAAICAINTYYGRAEVPIGAYHGNHGNPTPSKYTRALRDEFHPAAPADDKAPEALAVYRRALAGAGDGEVVIVSVGFLMNLADLIESPADAISPMTGAALVQKKVSRLVVMGGEFPNLQHREEWNFSAGHAPHVAEDTRHVIDAWPTPILFSGFSIGVGISTGPALAATPANNPVRRAYELFDNALKNGRSSWDLTTVLAALRDPKLYWNVVSGGSCEVDAQGISSWVATRDRGHSYLTPKLSNSEVAKALGELMATAPAHVQTQPTTRSE